MKDEVLVIKPYFTHNIWGGTRLREDFNYNVEGDDIGECWGISAHPNGEGEIVGGTFDGVKLSALWKEQPELFGNLSVDRFPLLVKIIDAKDDLSIQVHPDDAYAMEHENGSLGKTECWYILECEEGAELVIGHNASSKDELKSMIYEKRWQDFIRRIPVKAGDFIQINPGTVHAITGGILLLETQQNSDITYRVYDYDRLSNGKPRDLHVEQSIDVITVPAIPGDKCIIDTNQSEKNSLNLLYQCNYYSVYKAEIDNELCFERFAPFILCSVIDGAGTINGIGVEKGVHIIISNFAEKVEILGNLKVIMSTP